MTYHPAYPPRDPRRKKEAWLDLQRVMKYLGMSVLQRSLDTQRVIPRVTPTVTQRG